MWKEKKLYGKTSFGTVRTTYLIDEEGIIIKAIGNVKAADNPSDVLEILYFSHIFLLKIFIILMTICKKRYIMSFRAYCSILL